MQSDLIVELPFSDDTQGYLNYVCAMPAAVALESGSPGSEDARYSIYAAAPVEVLKIGGHGALATMREISFQDLVSKIKGLHKKYFRSGEAHVLDNRLPFQGGLAGFIAYPKLEQRDSFQVTSAYIGVYLWAIVVDHLAKTAALVLHPTCAEDVRTSLRSALAHGMPLNQAENTADELVLQSSFNPHTSVNTYAQAFDSIEQYIHAGDVYQVNLTQKFSASCSGSALAGYLTLRETSPGPFNAFIDLGSEALLCLSPERFLRVADGCLETKPIKGTRKRLSDPAADKLQVEALRSSEKDKAENLMIVDLLRNDMGKVSETGSVRVTELFALKTFSNVHHLVTTIIAQLTADLDAMDALSACFPGGSITGAPKLRAMEIIEEVETSERGPYCGSVFYWDSAGRLDSNIAIRSLRWVKRTPEQAFDRIECWAGGGIVADSTCEDEYAECFHKVQNLLDALSRSTRQASEP